MARRPARLRSRVEGSDVQTPPFAFHVMVKPRGAVCNLACEYCFYLDKKRLYPDETAFRMPDAVLERFTRDYIHAQGVPQVNFGWQGGEPTLMGVEFFRRAVDWQARYARRGWHVLNSIQTNGTLLDDEWCEFLREHRFLVGLSLDGPKELHDAYRRDRSGRPTFERVMRALRLLQEHCVEFNILCVVNRRNGDCPLDVYRFLRTQGVEFIQFIPAVGRREDGSVTDWSVLPEQYGEFLCDVFDEWADNDVGRVFVQTFEVALGIWLGRGAGLCIFGETCGNALALEHNGDLYSCDHFVFPEYRLGNIMTTPLGELVRSPVQRAFGWDKRARLPKRCRECKVLFACNGGCPKDRFRETPEGEPGLNYLCEGYRQFFTHIDPVMRRLGQELVTGGVRPGADRPRIG